MYLLLHALVAIIKVHGVWVHIFNVITRNAHGSCESCMKHIDRLRLCTAQRRIGRGTHNTVILCWTGR